MHGGMGNVARQSGSNIRTRYSTCTNQGPVDQIPTIANISAYRRMGDTI